MSKVILDTQTISVINIIKRSCFPPLLLIGLGISQTSAGNISNYCKTLNIRGFKFSRFSESDTLAHFNFGVQDILWLKIVKKI